MTITKTSGLFGALSAAAKVDPTYSLSLAEAAALWGFIVDSWTRPNVVEIGVFRGRASLVLAAAADLAGGAYWACDPFGPSNTQADFLALMNAHGFYPGLLGSKSSEALWNNGPIHVLVIDGDHEEPGIEADCRIWLPRVASRGIVAFDDYDDGIPQHAGIKKHADLSTGSWERFKVSSKMLVARKP